MESPRLIIVIARLFAELHRFDWQQKTPLPRILIGVQLDPKSLLTLFPVTVFYIFEKNNILLFI